jgi:hypothetical protein
MGTFNNGLFTDVTVCNPDNSSSCQTVSGVLVDTGSYGLRVVSSALSISLKSPSGGPLAECATFLTGKTWGPVQLATVEMSGEQAGSVPVQVINSTYADPAVCSSDPSALTLLQSLGINGILGIGNFLQDCGDSCAPGTTSNPGMYYSCPSSSSCVVTTVPLAQQVQNPVALFAKHNNGVIVQLPAITSADGGATSVPGFLIFGVGTSSNNQLPSGSTTLDLDQDGDIITVFDNVSYPSFIDSGSNALYFLNHSTTGIPLCGAPNTSFYCPASPELLTAENEDYIGNGRSLTFTISSAFANSSDPVFDNVSGPLATPLGFDWGLPFFFGRSVYVTFENSGSSAPNGSVSY